MNRVKLFITTLMVTALIVSSVTVGAATGSVKKTPITSDNAIVTAKNLTYNAKDQSVKLSVKVNGETLVEGTDYTLSVATVKNAGKYTKTVTITGIGHYEGTYTTTVKFVVKKKAQKLKSLKARKVKASKVKAKSVKLKLKIKASGKGKIKYKRVSKALTVSKKGRVTIKKGTKKGTYIVKVRAKATKNFKKTKWKRIKIKVK